MSAATPPVVQLAELSARGIDPGLAEYVKSLVSRVLLSEESFTSGVAVSYVRKAHRFGVWRRLNPVSRALLLAVSKWRGVVKSPVLRGILARIYVEIELYTVRGRAVFYGIILALSRARELLEDIAGNLRLITTMGIQYMNLPVLWRVYG